MGMFPVPDDVEAPFLQRAGKLGRGHRVVGEEHRPPNFIGRFLYHAEQMFKTVAKSRNQAQHAAFLADRLTRFTPPARYGDWGGNRGTIMRPLASLTAAVAAAMVLRPAGASTGRHPRSRLVRR